jgi:thiamine biosynthesis lipoprotein
MQTFNKIPLIIIFFVFLTGCGWQKEVPIEGKTMGTTYHIKIITGYLEDVDTLKKDIEKRLESIDKSMSTYRKDSEISKFNTLKRVGEKVSISKDFYQVMTVAEKLYKLTNGAWDGTIKPIVDLWGFGSSERKEMIPTKQKIRALLSSIGFHWIQIFDDHFLAKKKSAISLDLASIAKGYAVDAVAALLTSGGIENYLIEIGGEVYASGLKKDGQPWKIGINQPLKEAPFNLVYKTIALRDMALATSGDYRNFFEIDGKRYSHVIDPITGYPVHNRVVSVSIIANTCTFADGLATAIMVLGVEKGLALINGLEHVEGLIVIREDEGTLRDYYSKGIEDLLRLHPR